MGGRQTRRRSSSSCLSSSRRGDPPGPVPPHRPLALRSPGGHPRLDGASSRSSPSIADHTTTGAGLKIYKYHILEKGNFSKKKKGSCNVALPLSFLSFDPVVPPESQTNSDCTAWDRLDTKVLYRFLPPPPSSAIDQCTMALIQPSQSKEGKCSKCLIRRRIQRDPPPLFLSVSQTDYCYKKNGPDDGRSPLTRLEQQQCGGGVQSQGGGGGKEDPPRQTCSLSSTPSHIRTHATATKEEEEETEAAALPEWLFLWGRGVERRGGKRKGWQKMEQKKLFSLLEERRKGVAKKHPLGVSIAGSVAVLISGRPVWSPGEGEGAAPARREKGLRWGGGKGVGAGAGAA